MDGNNLPGARPPELTVAAYNTRLAEIDGQRIRIEREIADLVAAFAKHAASVRAARKRPAPGALTDHGETVRAEEAGPREREQLAQGRLVEHRPTRGPSADHNAEYNRREALRAEEAELAEKERLAQAQVAEFRGQLQELVAPRATLLRERDALRRLDAWDALTEATRRANAANEAIAAFADATERDARHRRADAAIRRRRELWLVWHLQFGGNDVPELLPLPYSYRGGRDEA